MNEFESMNCWYVIEEDGITKRLFVEGKEGGNYYCTENDALRIIPENLMKEIRVIEKAKNLKDYKKDYFSNE
jgi:hypothetical protein